ncbi:hypothetical protein [Pseudobacteriovorax antillogorgiicola]|uniref:Response regulator receiver domain-containing protein n=1 Tax=Pseudobacteriovorax antillogorgiicola TaxID=1513793 RepID=A0A1Y6CC69_9BACT|nr:hypothetical protein [Pseudobacteriovorax antillogorgiicola]TCS48328.1 hypothetical protein EDD56_118108 [Pseudobacteriovorax antillogorgiicola]SMF56515.1 hypothetical protein SAMN06296036_11833 [Pseudobacteriovorax antillogorgiicola]
MVLRPAGNFKVPTAVAYSAFDRKLNIIIKDIISKRGWRLEGTHTSEDECFALLTTGKASLLVIDDTVEVPASFILREQIFNVVPVLTPTIIICSEHNEVDMKCMMAMGEPVIVKKPLTPQKFLDAFDRVIKRWSAPPFGNLREAAFLIANGQRQNGYKLLAKMVQNQAVHHIASAALSLYYRQKHDFLMTEKILYNAFKAGEHQMSIILSLIDLYLYSGCPRKALELLKKANYEYNNPNFLCIDAIQAHLLLNQIRECSPYLTQMIENDYFADVGRYFLPRIAYSSGLLDLFDKSIRYRPDKFDEYQRAWHVLSDKDAKRRLSQYEQVSVMKKLKEREERLRIGKTGKEEVRKELTIDQSRYMEIGKPLFRLNKQNHDRS